MKRLALEQIGQWYTSSMRKPLVLKGARQVGKTYAVNQFGSQIPTRCNGVYHNIDLNRDRELHSIFQENSDPQKILELLEIALGKRIDRQKDLIFLDEIQECSGAIGTLKYFAQDMPELALITAGSHLGLLDNNESFPVGKVNFISMFPLTFDEFVMAVDRDGKISSFLESFDLSFLGPLPTIIHQKFLEYLRQYLAVGGMPEVVAKFVHCREQNGLREALKEARKVQLEILTGYAGDFAKYSGVVNANHIYQFYQAVPRQLAANHDSSVKRFKFSQAIPGQRGLARLSGPLTWLAQSRLCIQALIANRAGHPLLAYTKENCFKLFYSDVGLLNAALETPVEAIVGQGLDSYKGFIFENFIACELFAQLDSELISWREGISEVEFLITRGEKIIPLEVKSSARSRRAKSLDSYINRYHPEEAYKLTAQNIGRSERGYSTLPLYLVSKLLTE